MSCYMSRDASDDMFAALSSASVIRGSRVPPRRRSAAFVCLLMRSFEPATSIILRARCVYASRRAARARCYASVYEDMRGVVYDADVRLPMLPVSRQPPTINISARCCRYGAQEHARLSCHLKMPMAAAPYYVMPFDTLPRARACASVTRSRYASAARARGAAPAARCAYAPRYVFVAISAQRLSVKREYKGECRRAVARRGAIR